MLSNLETIALLPTVFCDINSISLTHLIWTGEGAFPNTVRSASGKPWICTMHLLFSSENCVNGNKYIIS